MANRKDDIKARLLTTFRVEADEHLHGITANLSALALAPPSAEAPALIEATFREVHTLKGAARSVGLLDVEALCQACESVLSRVTKGQLTLSQPLLRGLRDVVEEVARLLTDGRTTVAVRELIDRLERVSAEPATEAAPPPSAVPHDDAPWAKSAQGAAPTDILRLPITKLDALLLQAEDLLVPKLAVGARAAEAKGLVEALAGLRTVLSRAQSVASVFRSEARGANVLATLESGIRKVETQAHDMLAHLVRDERLMTGTVEGLHAQMRGVRMTPAVTVLELFPRIVRDLAAEQGKEVECAVSGADLDVDRKVLQAIKDPLIHLVRNAVDHGIEMPEARAQAGKSRQGRVAVTIAPLEGNRVEVRVEDDGRGIDVREVREGVVRARVLTSEHASALTDEAALELIYRSGVSTSPIITGVSGHGLGLAIVKERVEQLGGQIHAVTHPGIGTTVRMVLPATIATFRGLLVEAGGQVFLLPTGAVERVIRLGVNEIKTAEGRATISWDGRSLTVSTLSAVLGLREDENSSDPGHKRPCAVMRSGDERAGLVLDEILGEREVLTKELTAPLVRVPNVVGAGLLGTGELVLILRPADLLKSVRRAAGAPMSPRRPKDTTRQPRVLVVDDSITTRTMEKNLLEAAGYEVRVAADGTDAWTALRSEAFDLVVSDVDMPRLDGFELTARIRADRKLADLPVILVTALESREDKERGIDVGANAYVVKSSFDQTNLLEIIHRLV